MASCREWHPRAASPAWAWAGHATAASPNSCPRRCSSDHYVGRQCRLPKTSHHLGTKSSHLRERDMPTRFMTDPHEMRSMAGRFDVHAQTVEDEARKMWASSQNIAGAGWSGTAQMTSYDTMGQMTQAFRNIVNMLHGVRDGLIRDANNYEQQEQGSQQMLSSSPSP